MVDQHFLYKTGILTGMASQLHPIVQTVRANIMMSHDAKRFTFAVTVLCFGARFSTAALESPSARYDNYHLYEVTPTNDQQIGLLRELESTSDSYVFLGQSGRANESVGMIVAPHKLSEFASLMQSSDIDNRIVQLNVQDHIDREATTNLRSGDTFGWTSYHTLDSIYSWLDSLVAEYPDIITPLTVGTSFEGRPIRGVHISKRAGNPGIFVESGIHAREWISPAFATYLINELLTSNVDAIREISESYDWYIVPSINPDGYAYSHERNRMWRKTRRPHGPRCFGVDMNRNWDFHWGKHSTSTNPCSQVFGGPKAFSENETIAYSNYMAGLKGKIQTFLSFHAYSQLILLPYGHTSDGAPNHKDLMQIGLAAANALAKRYETKYKVGSVYNTIYPASGGSADYVFEVLEVPLAFTYELRPKSFAAGFELPAEQIIPVGEETLDSLVALLRTAKKLGYNKTIL